ncbi:MAG: TlpA family protein disulfide reductase [Desulfobacteraceae bacterium]|nr:TlpA family protein disulfide reductase [Desulfobacteraceae bacterium]
MILKNTKVTHSKKHGLVKFIFFTASMLAVIMVLDCTRKDKVVPGVHAKDFTLNSLSNERFYLNQHKDRPVLLMFWATWCKNCHYEISEMNQSDLVKHDKVTVALICIDPENREALERLAKTFHPRFKVLIDNKQKVFRQYGMRYVPATILINRQGIAQILFYGHSPAQLRASIQTAIAMGGAAQDN